VIDPLMHVMSYAPYRCRACEKRFYRHMRILETDEETEVLVESVLEQKVPELRTNRASAGHV
jgi:hypothetical protein